ncbi:MAG: SMP-30/gluconolactonase/LRE family protein, partial [Candidatus Didemnitutus sp.]|nr:SMP-30/gluconolactonase/LRE family protein [Candidatus Didemnitutus sp.]
MKKYQTLLLSALVALGGVNAGAQTNNISSLAITTGVVAVTPRIGPNTTPLNNQPVGNTLAGMAYAAGNIPGAADTSISFFTLTSVAIPGGIGNPADAFTSYGTLIGPPTVYGSYADVSAKLLSDNYAGLTFAAPNLYPGGPAPLTSSGFYMIHHATNGTDYLSAIVPLTGGNSDVVNLKPMSWAGGSAATGANTGLNGFFALAFAGPQPTGLYNANDFYYFRTDGATTRFGYVIPALTSGYLDTINLNTAVGGFGVGGYTTLAFSDTAIGGYAVNQFYYLRTDSGTGGTGHTILGRLDTNPAARTISDIANLGGTYKSLVFAADATGAAGAWGINQFYVTGTRALTGQSVSFAAIADQATGVSFTVSPSASSGLAMTLAVVAGSTGAASISTPVGGVFTVTPTAPGVITLQATQAGQAAPAAPVYDSNMLRQSFNATGTTLLAITTQPTAQSAVTGTTANFSVVASGTTALSYQWRKAGVNISGILNASATTANLSLTNAQAGDQASYDVAVTNASGTIYSNSVALTVTAPVGVAPVITNSPLTAAGTVGAAFSFTITASNSPTSYSASGLPAGLAINTTTGAITGTPTVAGSTSVTLGATNATGTGNATLTITVAALPAAPTFASSTFSAAGTVGTAFSYTITATGSPTSYVASPLPAGLVRNATTGAITGTPTTAGTTSVQLGATNSLGTSNATLTITITAAAAPPTVITQPVNRTVTAGQSTTFTVAAGNDPSVTYQWQRLPFGSTTWENLREGGSYRGVTTATLVVSDPTRATSGDQFRAVITNTTHTTTSNPVALTVTGGETALFQYPGSIAMDSAGNLYVADSFSNTIRKITSAGAVSTLAGSTGMAGSQNGTGDAARFNQPGGVAVDAAGNVYVADTGNATIRKITPTGVVTTLAGTADVRGNSDGVGSAASFGSPSGIAIDSAGNLYVADAFNATIRKITSTGTVSTLAGSATLRGTADGAGAAARFNYPNGVAVDAAGTIYVADTYNATIRKITSAGVVTTLAGLAGVSGADNGTGIMALFNQPNGLTVDTSGNVYVADTGSSTIRRITPAGVVTTHAGVPGIAGLENGPGGNALFNQPRGLVVSGSQIFVADTGNATIRVIAANNAVSTLTMAAASTASPAP